MPVTGSTQTFQIPSHAAKFHLMPLSTWDYGAATRGVLPSLNQKMFVLDMEDLALVHSSQAVCFSQNQGEPMESHLPGSQLTLSVTAPWDHT